VDQPGVALRRAPKGWSGRAGNCSLDAN